MLATENQLNTQLTHAHAHRVEKKLRIQTVAKDLVKASKVVCFT